MTRRRRNLRMRGGVRRRVGKRSKGVDSFPLSATSYPIGRLASDLSVGRTQMDQLTVPLHYELVVTTDASGLLQSVFSNNPSSCPNWSGLSGPYEQYRVLATVVSFKPYTAVGGATQTYWAPISTVLDRDDATALTSHLIAAKFTSVMEFPGMTPFTRSLPMNAVNESGFVPCITPVADTWIKFYSSGNTASLSVGRVQITYLVQFRGMGIS